MLLDSAPAKRLSCVHLGVGFDKGHLPAGGDGRLRCVRHPLLPRMARKTPRSWEAAQAELRLHAARDFIYATLFGTLPWVAWQGWWVAALSTLLISEVALTLADFVVEDWVRKPLGGIYPGERVMHGLMGVVYGAMLANLSPTLRQWWNAPSELTVSPVPVPDTVRWCMLAMAAGVFLSGVRDLCAAVEVPRSAWPWSPSR